MRKTREIFNIFCFVCFSCFLPKWVSVEKLSVTDKTKLNPDQHIMDRVTERLKHNQSYLLESD